VPKSSSITYIEIINRVREKLDCGPNRIADQPGPFPWCWWPSAPGFANQLNSDYGMESGVPELEKEFHAEVEVIREALDQLGHEPTLTGWQELSGAPTRRLMRSLDQAVTALTIWDAIGVPIRRKGDIVFLIRAPRDVLGSPCISAMSVDSYLGAVTEKTATDRVEIEALKKRLDLWRTGAIVLGIAIALLIMCIVKASF